MRPRDVAQCLHPERSRAHIRDAQHNGSDSQHVLILTNSDSPTTLTTPRTTGRTLPDAALEITDRNPTNVQCRSSALSCSWSLTRGAQLCRAHGADAREGTEQSHPRVGHDVAARRHGLPRTAAGPAAVARAGQSHPAWPAHRGVPPSRADPYAIDGHRGGRSRGCSTRQQS